jgi:hypothetical protein
MFIPVNFDMYINITLDLALFAVLAVHFTFLSAVLIYDSVLYCGYMHNVQISSLPYNF